MATRTPIIIVFFVSILAACGDDSIGGSDGGRDSASDGSTECEGMADGTSCGVGAVCIDEICVAGRCGDGVLEPDAGEECDDGANGDDGDGCKDDCSFTCTEDLDCDDNNACTGSATCESATHTCVSSVPLDCDDADPCTIDECDMLAG